MSLQLLICEVSACENAVLTWFILYWHQFIRISYSFSLYLQKVTATSKHLVLMILEKKIGPYDAHDRLELRI